MTLVAVDLTEVRRTAKQVVAELCRVHTARKNLKISRKQFLARWGRLRIELATTREYRILVRRVMTRDKVCRICGGDGYQAHHIERVARAPHKALDIGNLVVVCKTHHDFIHSAPTSPPRAEPTPSTSRQTPLTLHTQLTSPSEMKDG